MKVVTAQSPATVLCCMGHKSMLLSVVLYIAHATPKLAAPDTIAAPNDWGPVRYQTSASSCKWICFVHGAATYDDTSRASAGPRYCKRADRCLAAPLAILRREMVASPGLGCLASLSTRPPVTFATLATRRSAVSLSCHAKSFI